MAEEKPYAMIPFGMDISGSRKILIRNISQINKLESFAGLENLNLILVDDNEKIPIIFYEGIAPEDLYPNVGERLIERKVIRIDNFMGSKTFNKGKDNEYEEVRMSLDFIDSGAWVFLKAYNPNYNLKPKSKILKTELIIN